MTTKCRRRIKQRRLSGLRGQHLRAAFLGGLKSLGACTTGSRLRSTRFDSTQRGHHMTWRKRAWWVWRGVGWAMAPLCLVHVLTQRKKDGCQWGFSQTWIFFQKGFFFSQHLGPDAFSAVRGQWIRAKNIKDIKEHFSKLFRIANIFVQYKGLAQYFFNT